MSPLSINLSEKPSILGLNVLSHSFNNPNVKSESYNNKNKLHEHTRVSDQAPPSTTHKLNRDYFKRATAGGKRQRGLLATSGLYKQVREVSVTTQLPPGCYVIIPSCFQPEHAAEFLIRVFSENNMVMKELLQAGDGNDEPTVATSVSELAKSSFGSILL